MTANAYILSLDRAVERRAQVKRTIESCPVPCSVISAVDGSLLPEETIRQIYKRHLHSPRYIAELRRAEIGCFLSHREVWKKIVAGDADFSLVIEDDIELHQPEFNSAFAFASEHIQPGDYVKFHISYQGKNHRCLASDGHCSLVQPLVAPLGTTSQLVTREAAARLLDCTEQFDRPVDTFLQMFWLTGVPIKIITPICVSEISNTLGGSLISRKKPVFARLGRELMRPLYRFQIQALSHLHRERR